MKKSFLGVGWKFPIDLDLRKGVALSEYEQNIEESIMIIIGTFLGERVMRPDFGCRIHELIFHPNNPTTHGLCVYYVEKALLQWEPRIRDVKVEAKVDEDDVARVNLGVTYQVIATNNLYNIVYPFYLSKAEG